MLKKNATHVVPKLRVKTVTRLHLVEGVMSNWAYHLSVTGNSGQPSLCGDTRVMSSGVPFTSWNTPPGHIRMSYCAKCTKLAKAHGFAGVVEAGPDTLTFNTNIK